MKFLKFINNNNIKNGYLENNKVFELKNDILDYFNQNYDEIIKEIDNSKTYNLEDIKIINPVSPSKIVCIGLNYKDHAKELNMELPDTPKLFIKPSTSVIGNNDNIIKPEMSNEIDYEGELAIVIGKKAKNVEVHESKNYIFGYTILNDVTARDVQRYDEQWTRGKSFDTFAPIGPVIETDLDPQNQKITTRIIKNNNDNKINNNDENNENNKNNNSNSSKSTISSVNNINISEKNMDTTIEIRQNSNTSNMVFGAYELLSFISKVMTLNPGDIIATGTPPGVGQIKIGETVEVEIEDIGVLSNKLISE
ncbi:MAG: fumarylacetoacetate hydrolase family protein [Methanobacteriaceae archaeon]|nr:fumarylacetoacetate hydrolase family protein [Methanobacteriaceae archaeon]